MMLVRSSSLCSMWKELANELDIPQEEISKIEELSKSVPTSIEEKCFHVIMYWKENNQYSSLEMLQTHLRHLDKASLAGIYKKHIPSVCSFMCFLLVLLKSTCIV